MLHAKLRDNQPAGSGAGEENFEGFLRVHNTKYS